MVEINELDQILIIDLKKAIKNIAASFTRYNGGWIKLVTGLDKSYMTRRATHKSICTIRRL